MVTLTPCRCRVLIAAWRSLSRCALVASDGGGHVHLLVTVDADEPFVGEGFFDGGQVGALQVFDQSGFVGFGTHQVGADERGHSLLAG
jgi:hypothetical protein